MAQHYKHSKITLDRVKVFTGWSGFNTKGNVAPGRMDQNLVGRLWVGKSRDAVAVSCSQAVGRIPFDSASQLPLSPIAVGFKFGPAWSSFWLKLDISVPLELQSAAELHLLLDCNCEALIFSDRGEPLQALTGGSRDERREFYVLRRGGDPVFSEKTLFVEVACNGMFGNGFGGDIEPPELNRTYELAECCVASFDRGCWELLHDVTVLQDAAEHLPKTAPRRSAALMTANRVINACHVDDPSTFSEARKIASEWLSATSGDHSARVCATGHCHIDTAWLWTYAETVRKCARSWTTQLRLIREYDGYVFACSQAQQYAWIKESYPDLFSAIRTAVAEKRFLPVGGTWVEMDCNLPSGESLIRQFIEGQAFFEKEFGVRCREFWLPDTFGYASQLPQIMRAAGIEYFLTQKLSWNLTNKFPHSSFVWEGMDGSRVLAHFPPAETYISHGNVHDVLKSSSNNQDAGLVNESILLFGHGDGGGGATPQMLESLTRMKNVEGLPRVEFEHPTNFFDRLKKINERTPLPRWVGELYLEVHRGTYTSQAKTKLGNRKCELLLRELEIWASLAQVVGHHEYPESEVQRLWRLVLLNQFHDTLPGSSIGDVYVDAERHYAEVLRVGSGLLDQALTALLDALFSLYPRKRVKRAEDDSEIWVASFNSLGWTRGAEAVDVSNSEGIATYPDLFQDDEILQEDSDCPKSVALLPAGTLAGIGIEPACLAKPQHLTELLTESESGFVLRSSYLTAEISRRGQLTSLRAGPADTREDVLGIDFIAKHAPGNVIVTHDDTPLFWDAWDTEYFAYEKSVAPREVEVECRVVERGPVRASLRFDFAVGRSSRMTQWISITPLSRRLEFTSRVHWRESRKILRVQFPVNVRSGRAAYETQFGFLERNTHWNTSWDNAKFEVCAHRYCDLSQHGLGVALLNDSKYGCTVRDNVMQLSLLRSSKSPDATADMGVQHFTYAVYPHHEAFPNMHVVHEAHELNAKAIIKMPGHKIPHASFIRLSSMGSPECSVLISALYPAKKHDKALILRLYESVGAESVCKLSFSDILRVHRVAEVNLLEDLSNSADLGFKSDDDDWVTGVLNFRPFKIRSLVLVLA